MTAGPGGAAAGRGGGMSLRGRPIGVIGLGTMGRAMASRLAGAGALLTVFNRTSARAADFAAGTGAAVARSPRAAAAGADAVLVSVGADADLDEVLLGPDGVFAAVPAPGVILNTSTVAPATARRLSELGPLVDVGILGNRAHAAGGELRAYVGGGADLVELSRPVLDPLAKQILHVGQAGGGMRLKLAMNLLMGLEMQALAEVVALGEAGGIDRAAMLDAVTGSGFAAPVMRYKAGRMAAGRFGDPDFRLALMAKDLSHAAAEAAASGTYLPMAEAAAHTHRAAVEAGHGDADCAVIVQAIAGPAEPGTPGTPGETR
jgi:3-hydroxyisobutyrate dehydrogenase-like beta-hydroxyacid dehydrogenase